MIPRIFTLLAKVNLIGALFLVASSVFAQTGTTKLQSVTSWNIASAKLAYGLPDVKAGKKGALTLDANGLTFTNKTSNAVIPHDRILEVSNGSDRVELWGTTGQIMRMMIPQGGGLAAGAVLHHRVGMLTVDFLDNRGGKHAAVFDMPPAQAAAALTAFSQTPLASHPATPSLVHVDGPIDPTSVLVVTPNWAAAQVPAAYRALVYEQVITRLEAVKGISHVYRDGEVLPDGCIPAYTIQISIKSFKKGNQIERASLGPVGMFVGTTRLVFNFNVRDAYGHVNQDEEIKTSVRMQSESTAVTDKFAKSLAKRYVAFLKREQPALLESAPARANAFR